MIQTKKDLYFYLTEDFERNGFCYSCLYIIKRWILDVCGSERAKVLGYLILLRKCEYHHNNKRLLHHKIAYFFYKVRLMRLGAKLNRLWLAYSSYCWRWRVLIVLQVNGELLWY